ncbi:MAG: hypothetical protein DRI75_13305 [Bacteroidetes bacterium]|nr:MAG: hypothetical protein DRI75_13305 [Bacteroidota bacterium]
MKSLKMIKFKNLFFGLIAFLSISCSDNDYEKRANALLIELNINEQTPIDSILCKVAEHFDIPGITATVTNQDSIIEKSVYGVINSRFDELLTFEKCFDIYSISKSFSALIIMQLVEEGFLNLDDELNTIFPELSKNIHKDYKAATLEDLLTHQSGLSRNGRHINETIRPIFKGTLMDRREQFTLWILDQKSNNTMGEFNYSNAGFVIVGAVIEKVTGNSFENEIQDRIFSPLKMKSGGFGWPVENAGDFAYGHIRDNRKVVPVRYADWYLYGLANPAGGIHMSINDLSVYTREHLLGLKGKSKLLKRESFEIMHKIEGVCGLGWYNSVFPTYKGSEVGGTDDGYRSEIFISTQKNIGVTILTNINDRNDWIACKTIKLAMLRKY